MAETVRFDANISVTFKTDYTSIDVIAQALHDIEGVEDVTVEFVTEA